MKETAIQWIDHWFHTPDDWEKSGGVWPVRMGANIAKPSYRVGPKSILCHSLHFIREGKLLLSYAERQLELSAGDCFCLFPGVTYYYRTLSPESEPSLRTVWLALDGPQIADLVQLAGLSLDQPVCRHAVHPELSATLQELQVRFQAGETTRGQVMLQSLIYKLFSQLLANDAPEPGAKSPSVWLERSLVYMELHLGENINVSDVAAHVGLHRSYFSKTFTERMNVSPIQYLQRLKMDKAVQMLTDPARTVTEIALSLGYPDLFSFTRAFKRYFGRSPSESRLGH